MDDSIITILVVVALGFFQLVVSINKKKRVREQAMRPRPITNEPNSEWEEFEDFAKMLYRMEEPEQPAQEVVQVKPVPVSAPGVLKPEEEGGPMNEPISILMEEAPEFVELLLEFTPQKAIIYSEVINPKWNSWMFKKYCYLCTKEFRPAEFFFALFKTELTYV